jgi:glycosyltransferase involved in cell wall biosynthesis
MSVKRNIAKGVMTVVRKTPPLRSFAQSAKRRVVAYVDNKRSQQEVYDVHAYYPTIQEYYTQTQQVLKATDPLISILLPVYNTPEQYLRECLDSILRQSYPRWELCIADDCSPDPRVAEIIREYCEKDNRIKFNQRRKNGHISAATNSALELASGTFIALMDHDDVLWPNALHEVVEVVRHNPKVDHIYTDEDKIDGSGTVHSYPFLKPDLSLEFLESCNYITHFSCIRTSVMRKIGGFRVGYEGAQDWDLFIRISEVTSNIVHIPKLLYSWRVHEASTASNTDAKPYVYEAQRKLLEDHIERQGVRGVVETGIIQQHRTIKYEPKEKSKLLVVIRCNSTQKLKRLLASMKLHDGGAEIGLLYVIESRSCTKEDIMKTHAASLGASFEYKIVRSKGDIYEQVLGESKNEYLLFMKDTTVVQTVNWAKIMLAEVQRPHIAFVGPVIQRLGTGTILSAGVGLGVGEARAADMLQGMPFDDPHYTRGLYAKSRRNVSAVSDHTFCTTRAILKEFDHESIIDTMYSATKKEYRNTYTPYMGVATEQIEEPRLTTPPPTGYEDPMLNPNFKKSNSYMEVRS